jgi:hypothetical protein
MEDGEVHLNFTYSTRGGEATVEGKFFPYSRLVVVGKDFPNPAAEYDLVEPFDKTEASLFHPVIAKRAIAATLFGYEHYDDPTVTYARG